MNLIIDVSNYLNRVYFGYTKALIEAKEGEVINFYDFALYSIKKIKEEKFTTVYTVWDTKLSIGATSFRTDLMVDAYKAGRDKSHYEEMKKLIPALEEFFTSMGFRNMYPFTLEADDVIAWLSKNLNGKTRIYSADTDMYQLINEDVHVFSPNKKKEITLKNFVDETGVEKGEYILYKCIKGDSSDNIDGIKGYGPVKAAKLAKEFLKNKKMLLEHKEFPLIQKNMKLMNLDLSLKMEVNKNDVKSFYEQFEKSINLKPSTYNFNKLCSEHGALKVRRSAHYWTDIFPKEQDTNDMVEFNDMELSDDMPEVLNLT